jgi:hypothetical protein
MTLQPVIQVVPRAPGLNDGVGDYAALLAVHLRNSYSLETCFISGTNASSPASERGFRVLSPLRTIVDRIEQVSDGPMILHYVNYGYHQRGIPLWLPGVIRQLKGHHRLLTIFHELYAGGSFRQSAFWLRPLQIQIAGEIAQVSDIALVTAEPFRTQLHRLRPDLPIIVQPVPSNLGEPDLPPEQIKTRDPQTWVICGGKELVERSVRSLIQAARRIAKPFAPRRLLVLGGSDNPAVRNMLDQLPDCESSYYPNVSAASASELLSCCSFGWIDYFKETDGPSSLLLKSGAFAALCAHGVIPVTRCKWIDISFDGEPFPARFRVTSDEQYLPSEESRLEMAQSVYNWYRQHSCSAHLARKVKLALETSE